MNITAIPESWVTFAFLPMSLFRRCVWLLAVAAVLAASAVAAPQPPSPGEVNMDPYDVLGVDRDASQVR